MKNKKLVFGVYSFLCLLIIALLSWFLILWIPKIKPAEHVIELIVIGAIMLVALCLALIFGYKVSSKFTENAVLKGINSSIATLFLVAGVGLVLLSALSIYNNYSGKGAGKTIDMTFGIIMGVVGIIGLLLSLFMFHRNNHIVESEKRLEKYNATPEKIETFADKKVNKSCKFCGCRLKSEDKNCPNCGSKIE